MGITSKDDEYETKDSGKRQTFSTGMQRDSGEKDLYRELYGNLDRCLMTRDRMLRCYKNELIIKAQVYCNISAKREDLEEIVLLVHNIEAAKNDEYLIGGRCLSLDQRHAALMKRGAIKYDRGNWKKAETEEELERFKDSLLRHTKQYVIGLDDEDHATAILFNAGGCAMVEDKISGVIDK